MSNVYLLYHLSTLRSGDQQVLFVGAYKTRASALRAIDRLKKQPGFKQNPKLRNQKIDHGDGFNINRVRFGSDNWSAGFNDEI
jgi:hypothetical protein